MSESQSVRVLENRHARWGRGGQVSEGFGKFGEVGGGRAVGQSGGVSVKQLV